MKSVNDKVHAWPWDVTEKNVAHSGNNSTPVARRSCLLKIDGCGPVSKFENGLPEILQAIEELFAMRS